MNIFDAHTAKENEAELIQKENLGGNLPEQTAPSAGDIQKQVEIEKLLRSESLACGYVYQDGQRAEYLFQGTPENIAYFIDKCPDQGLLDEIKKTLIPIQKGEAQAQPFFCPTLDEVEEYYAQRDPMDMDEDREMDTGVNIDPDLGF